ncbi:MAG: cupin-like domain-containing protein, partial [Schleiferiaceae bacterium]
QNSPWMYSSHFDCYDQYVYMLHGKKRWLLFDLDDLETERKLVLQFAGKNIETVSEILRANGIPFKIKTIRAGDVLFIPEGQYHLVENEGSQGTIFVNSPINKPVNLHLQSKFESLWPKWYSGT